MIKAVVFDLDGTITRPFLNFKQIRMEVGVLLGRQSLLDQIESMSEAERKRGLAILEHHENEAAVNAELNLGVRDLMAYVRSHGILSAVVTRNSENSTSVVLEKLKVSFDRVITRDHGLPIKPDPAPLLELAREWRIEPSEMLMVGDFRYDVECGRAVGARTCFVTNLNDISDNGSPDYIVSNPGEVIDVLKRAGHASEGAAIKMDSSGAEK
jgi:HAD superfamily hydrolase (TIGR01509 family)